MSRKTARRVAGTLGCLLAITLAGAPTAMAQGQSGTTLSATKTATGHTLRTFTWTITKSVTPAGWNLFSGDTGTSEYTIAVTKTGFSDSGLVDGSVCVTNAGAVNTENLAIVDEVEYKTGSGQYQTLLEQAVDISAKPVLAPGESYCYPYSIGFTPVPGANYRNTAHVTITNHSGHLGEAFGPEPKAGFSLPSQPDVFVNATIHVLDSNGSSWTFTDSGNVSYPKTFACAGDAGVHTNTATIAETGQSASAAVNVTCYQQVVAKDASTSFTRTYQWTVDKTADQSALTLALGQSFTVNYAVTANANYTDANFAVQGNITVFNPAPIRALLTEVADVVSPSLGVNVTCGTGFPHLLPAGGTLQCSYAGPLPDNTSRLNTATVTLQKFTYAATGAATPTGTTSWSAMAGVDFSAATIIHVDRCAAFEDTLQGSLGNLCFGEATLPYAFSYAYTVGPYNTCGSYEVTNVASFAGTDTGTGGSDPWVLNVSVPCQTGCTLTQGYWKTHSSYGPAPYDDTWALIGEDTVFYQSGQSWYQVLWTSPKGGNAYYILAHQFIAARLNLLNGAASTSPVDEALAWAHTFFSTYTPTSQLSRSTRNLALTYAALLDQYNNGLAVGGPPHCSE